MRNPNNPVRDIDDRPKTNEEIKEMIERLNQTDEDGYPEKKNEMAV